LSQLAYSNFKAAWHLDDIRSMRNGEQIVPHQVQLIISDLCNHDCSFCAYRRGVSSEEFGEDTGKGFTMNPNRKIPTVKCMEILKDCATLGVRAIQFTGGGEPTVHPDHLTIFGIAQQFGMQTSLVTNGYLLRDGWRDILPKMAWIRVSVDAGTPETYAKIRKVPPDAMSRVLSNMRSISDCLYEHGSSCLFGAGFVVTPENWHEIVAGVKAIKETGVSYVRLSAAFSKDGSGPYKDRYEEIRHDIGRARAAFEDENFRVVDLFGERVSDLDQGAPDYEFCGYQQFNCYIGGNLRVYRCCTTSYTHHGEVGDLRDKTFADWFHSAAKRQAYSDFDARTCNLCQFNVKNRVIRYLTDKKPLHVDFV